MIPARRPEPVAPLRAPFPYFGGKRRAAALIWEGLGDVANYVEPFAGSLAVLLGRPTPPHIETVNDRDCYLANFWRAVQHEPEAVARHADWPVNEADLHARHLWLVQQAEFRERMLTKPDFYDVKIAGWWVWGLSCWIGGGWCEDTSKRRPTVDGWIHGHGVHRKRPRADGRSDAGLRRKRPIVAGDRDGNGIHRKLPRVDGNGGVALSGPQTAEILSWFAQLRARLRRTRVVCGDWSRVLTPTVLRSYGVTGVVLDPPYAHEVRDPALYAHDDANISLAARAWAIEHGDDPKLRIVLCGYEGEHDMPGSWRCASWKAGGGYANQNKTSTNENRHRERLWFSPHCLRPEKHHDLPLLRGLR